MARRIGHHTMPKSIYTDPRMHDDGDGLLTPVKTPTAFRGAKSQLKQLEDEERKKYPKRRKGR